jgi:hypothetical protein
LSLGQPDCLSVCLFVCLSAEVLQLWFMNNRMMLNPNKSEAMICGTWQRQRRSRSQLPSTVKVAGADMDVAVADHIRLLGVTVDNTLTWRKHVQEVLLYIKIMQFSSANATPRAAISHH